MPAVPPTDAAVKVVPAHELTTTSLCRERACPYEADGEDGRCHECRAAAQAPKPKPALPFLNDALGLEFDPGLDEDAWHAALRRVALVRGATNWWLGDLVANSEIELDVKVKLAAAETTLPESSIRTIEWTARSVTRERRRPELAFAHHMEVAALEPDEQVRWLEQAVRDRWGTRQLREGLEGERARRKNERAAASRLTDQQVARVYDQAREEGRPPVLAIAEHFEIPRTAASARVVRARRRGQLGENASPPEPEPPPPEQLEQLRLTIVLKAGLAARLRTLARERRTSMSQLAAEALERLFDALGPPDR
jgi:hypothetical protein